MASLAEVREELTQKRREMHKIFEEAGSDLDLSHVTSLSGDNTYKAAEIKRRNEELSELGTEFDRLSVIEMIGRNNATERRAFTEKVNEPPLENTLDGAQPRVFLPQQLKRMILNHKGYKAFRDGTLRSVSMDIPAIDFKTLIQLSTINRQPTRLGPVDMALEDRTVADLMLQGTTDNNTLEYYEETTFTNAADTRAEGVAKPESALGYTLVTESVRKIAHFIPATKEALDDLSFLESQIRGRLAFGIQRKEEEQILSGDGNAPNISGILDRADLQTQAKGADPTPDAVYKAMQKVRGASGAGFAEPTAYVTHPNDWTEIKLLRTVDGIYIWGNPSDEGPDRIWGLPVRQTTAMAEGTGLVGAFRPHAEVIRREGIVITLSTEHASYFIENKVAILAEERLALAVYRGSAFATVTGI